MSFQVEQIDHVEMLAEDPEALASWYHNVLGFNELGRFDPHPIMIGIGGTMLALFARGLTSEAARGSERLSKEPPPGFFRRVAFRTDAAGFEAAQRHLEACDVPFDGPVDHRVAWSLYFNDPEGHPLEITHYRKQTYPFRGHT